MQKFHIINFVLFCLNPIRLFTILEKIYKKNFYLVTKSKILINNKFINKNKSSITKFMMTNNNKLFLESKIFFQKLSKDSKKRLKKVNYDLGGGGAYNLLYFLVRKYKPKIVLETGVAAGFSSNAILNAMQQNKRGRLYSSDFPYFRIPRPESFIGILVDEHLKKNWNLFIEGDRLNIKKIKNKIKKNKVDLIHYDSDKTYLGKKKFFDTIEGFIHKKTIIIIDDIQDDIFFEEYSKKYTTRDIKIFKFKNKYLGLIY